MLKSIFSFVLFLISLRFVRVDEVENFKILDDIILSENETRIFSLDEYYTNSNLKFSITNSYSNIFKINLSESFNNLLNLEIKEESSLMKVKSLESIHSYVILFENTLMTIHWEQLNSIIMTGCSKMAITSIRRFNRKSYYDCKESLVKNPFQTVKCYDFEEIFLKEFDAKLTYIVIDCDLTDTIAGQTTQNYFFFSIEVSDKHTEATYNLQNFQNIEASYNLNQTRKIVYNNETHNLYRFSPYSLKQTPENTSILQKFEYRDIFRFVYISLVPNTTQYLENLRIINGTLLILDYQTNIYLFNISNQSYSDNFQIQTNEINIEVSYFQARLFILTNATIYRFSFSQTNTFQLIYQINITSYIEPDFITQTQDYVYLLCSKYILVMRIDDLSSKKMLDSMFQYIFPGINDHKNIMIKFPDQFMKNSFAIWILKSFNASESKYDWTMNITQIQKKLLYVECCDTDNINRNISMQHFYFILTVNDTKNNTVNLYYWNLDDYHLYFDPVMSLSYNDNQSLVYYFDSENIFIPYTSWVVGPLKKVQIQNVYPVCDNFKVDCNKTFNVCFDYLKTNQNFEVNYNTLISESSVLNFTLNSTILTIYWQTQKDLSFYIIDCFLFDNYLIEDCILTFRKDDNVFHFRSAFKYKNFHIINTENLSYVSTDEDPYGTQTDIINLKQRTNDGAPSCAYIYLFEKEDLLFCLDTPYSLQIFKLKYNETTGELWLDNKYIFTDINIQKANQIYIDFIDSYNCLIVSSNQNLYFYLFIFPTDENFQFSIIEKFNKPLGNFTDVFLIMNSIPLIVLIDYTNDQIEEYWLKIPFELAYLRNYPTFSYDFLSSFRCNERFLCLKILDHNTNYLIIYNVTEPTSKLLRYKISYDSVNDRILPLITNENNEATDSLFHNLFISSSIFVIINPTSGVSLKLNKVCDINGNIPQIFHDPQIKNQAYYNYTIILSFTNEMMKEMIFFKIYVNVSLLNSIISLEQPNQNFLNFINPPSNGSKYILYLEDSPFVGPVQNYKITNEGFANDDDIYSFYFYAFLDKNLDFEEDYDKERRNYGNFIKVLYKDEILIVLSEKSIIFVHYVDPNYEIIHYDNLDNKSCSDMAIHPTKNLLYVFCSSFSILHMICYEYNITSLVINTEITNLTITDLTPFKGIFQGYLSVLINDLYLFFLVDEGYYPELHKKKKSIYIFGLPQKSNNYSIDSYIKLSDKELIDRYFMMSDAIDFQVYHMNTTGSNQTSNFLIFILMTNNLQIVNFEFSLISKDVYVLGIYSNEYPDFSKSSYNVDILFYTVSLLNISANSENCTVDYYANCSFTVNYIISSNQHIYEFITVISDETGNSSLIPIRTYMKYYSCIYADDVRPKKYKDFLGSFCMKTDIIDGIVENGFNYFVLHKINSNNDSRVSPVLALPIYLKSYNFQFISRNNHDYLILPSFSSLFSEYELIPKMSLWIKKSLTSPSKITAFNDISNCSIYLNITISEKETFESVYIIIICVCSALAFILVGILIFWIYKRKKKNRILKSVTDSVIDNEILLKSRNNSQIFVDVNRQSQKKMINASTSFGSQHIRANSALRVKLKNDKWIES